MAAPVCRCPEMEWRDPDGLTRHHTHPWHDCAYVAARERLIPQAAHAATYADDHGNSRLDSTKFMAAMDRLWAEAHRRG